MARFTQQRHRNKQSVTLAIMYHAAAIVLPVALMSQPDTRVL